MLFRSKIIIKNKKLRTFNDGFLSSKALLQRTTTLEDSVDNDDDYDSDFGEDEFDFEQEEVAEQNLSLEEYQLKQQTLQVSTARPRTLSVSTSMTLQTPQPPQHRASVFADPTNHPMVMMTSGKAALNISELVAFGDPQPWSWPSCSKLHPSS